MNKNNNYLLICAIKVLKHRIEVAQTPQTKSALIFAHNLLVYVINNNEEKISEIMKKEGLDL